ncbi:MAG: signal recognition particle protein [Fibrobacteraceae bacterium]|nr:signal recognition particle protein [Fibrobacteraceae bacterium]
MFSQLTDSLESTLKNLRGQGKLTEENVAESLREVRRAFLEADVNFNVTRDFVKSVKEKALGGDVLLSVTPGQQIVKIIHDELVNTMGGETKEVSLSGPSPIGIMMVGLQGSGKTTFAGKIALYMRSKKKRKPLLVAADVYRPAAIKQLQVLGKSIGIPVYDEGQGNPVEIIKHGYEYAKENGFDLVIYDTAGRLQIDEELMVELEQASAAVKPNEIFFVADAMIGQEAVNVAETFFQRLNFTGVCLSKMDGDTRGGAALSIKKMTGVPICFVGLGEKLSDLDVFHPDRMASRILGMGDVVTLVEKAQAVIDEKDAKDLKKKIFNNTFDLNDFLNQLRTVKKIGRFKDILSLIPGLNKLPLDQIDDKELVYVEAILSSMTPKERKKPSIIDGSRKKRIANGSGTNVQRVNQILAQFENMKEMFKKIGNFAKKQNGGTQIGSNYTPPKKKKKKR